MPAWPAEFDEYDGGSDLLDRICFSRESAGDADWGETYDYSKDFVLILPHSKQNAHQTVGHIVMSNSMP